MEKNKRLTGGYYEKKAAAYLESRGMRILEYNFRCHMGEIDLIARDGRFLVFVEVKYRSTGRQGEAVEAVGKTKQQIISRVAAYYLLKRVHSLEIPCRFDVIAIDGDLIRWIPDAFAYCP